MQGTTPCAMCTQARKTTHGLDGQHQDVDRTPSGRVSQNDREQSTEINGESTSMVQPSDRGRLKNRTTVFPKHRILLKCLNV